MMNKLRILLADDHHMFREGLRLIVNSQADMEVIGEADNGITAVILAQELQPDIIVMDISMPQMNGLKATERLKNLCPAINVLTLTRHADSGYLQQLLRAGASGYVLKRSASDELVRAIRAIASGQKYLDPAVTNELIGGAMDRKGAHASPIPRSLSPREEDILRLIALGYANKEIATRLNLSIKTIEAHKANAMSKLNMRSRIDIVRYAMLRGWIEEN